jgi:hypothetical protein
MEMEEFKVKVTADRRKADELYSMMVNAAAEYMDLPALPITAIKDFIDDKRENLWEITIDGQVFLTVVSEREAALTLLKMIKGAGQEEFVMAPLPAANLRAFVQGQRDTVATLTIRRNPDVQVRVKPAEKVEEKAEKAEKAEEKTDKVKEKKEKEKDKD